jgi:hypothetical protein
MRLSERPAWGMFADVLEYTNAHPVVQISEIAPA